MSGEKAGLKRTLPLFGTTSMLCHPELPASQQKSLLISSGLELEHFPLTLVLLTVTLLKKLSCIRPYFTTTNSIMAINTTTTASPIPVVDFGKFLNGNDLEKKETASQIDHAFQEVGFVYLKNHGVAKEMIEKCFEWVRNPLFPIPI